MFRTTTPTNHITMASAIKMNSLLISAHDVQCIEQLHQLLVVTAATGIPNPQALHPP
jgi:hypothetical protein